MFDRRNVYPRELDKAENRVHSSYSSASISIESRRRPLIFDGSQLCNVQHTRCTRYASWRTFCASPHGGSGPTLFSKCVASTRSPIFFLLFSFSVFLFSFFFFRRASAADWSQRRHGVSSALPFSSCACRRRSRRGSARVRQHGRPRRRMATRATNATRRARYAIPQAILRSRTFSPSLFLPVCARSLRRPNEPD